MGAIFAENLSIFENSSFDFGNGYFDDYYGQTLFLDCILMDIMLYNGERPLEPCFSCAGASLTAPSYLHSKSEQIGRFYFSSQKIARERGGIIFFLPFV